MVSGVPDLRGVDDRDSKRRGGGLVAFSGRVDELIPRKVLGGGVWRGNETRGRYSARRFAG